MKRIVLLLIALLEAACIFLICWFPPQKKAETDFHNASITITGSLMLTLTEDTVLQGKSAGSQPLELKKGDKVRIRRLTETSVEFYGDETKEFPGTLPVTSFAETDKINELLAPSRNAEEYRRDDYLDNCLIKNIVVSADFFAVMGGLCLLASIKHEWMGFALNILLVAISAVIILALKDQLALLLF